MLGLDVPPVLPAEASFVCDGDGNRVKKIENGVVTSYFEPAAIEEECETTAS